MNSFHFRLANDKLEAIIALSMFSRVAFKPGCQVENLDGNNKVQKVQAETN